MKINLIILAVIFALASALAIYTQQKPPQFNTTSNESEQAISYLKAPNFSYVNIEGRESDLYDHQGRVVLLHFWATWCAPCLVEFPELVTLANNKQDELVILAVTTDHAPQAIPRFLNRLNLNLPNNFIIIPDEDKSITQDLYQTFKLPETYLIDTQSNIREKLIGPQEGWDSDVWHQKIESIRVN